MDKFKPELPLRKKNFFCSSRKKSQKIVATKLEGEWGEG